MPVEKFDFSKFRCNDENILDPECSTCNKILYLLITDSLDMQNFQEYSGIIIDSKLKTLLKFQNSGFPDLKMSLSGSNLPNVNDKLLVYIGYEKEPDLNTYDELFSCTTKDLSLIAIISTNPR